MGIFGWSMPPGCGSTPYDDAGASDLTPLVTLPAGVVGVFWDEDGNLLESYVVNVPADEAAGLPEYADSAERKVGQLDWDDELDDDANLAAAAAAYNRLGRAS